MDYSSAIKRNEVPLIRTTACMNLENVTLSERNHTQKTIYCMLVFIRNVQKRPIYSNRKEMSIGLGKKQGVDATELGGSFWNDGSVLKLDYNNACTTLQFTKTH